MSHFLAQVAAELDRARTQHALPFHSYHEGLAVIQEEVFELQTEVYQKPAARNPQAAYTELVQIAAMCLRFAQDLLTDWDTAPPAAPTGEKG